MIKKHTLWAAACLAFCCFAFTPSPQQQSPLFKQLVGEWRNIYVKISIASKTPGGAPQIMEADSTNWEARLRIKPIRTHFNTDGTYYSEYFSLKDSLARKVTGTWALKADSIIMKQLTPDKSDTRLKISIANNVATFSGMIDFTGSGKFNDAYYGRQRKFK